MFHSDASSPRPSHPALRGGYWGGAGWQSPHFCRKCRFPIKCLNQLKKQKEQPTKHTCGILQRIGQVSHRPILVQRLCHDAQRCTHIALRGRMVQGVAAALCPPYGGWPTLVYTRSTSKGCTTSLCIPHDNMRTQQTGVLLK